MQNLLPDARYLWREFLSRAVLMTVSFKWLLPLTTLFQFNGGLGLCHGLAVGHAGGSDRAQRRLCRYA